MLVSYHPLIFNQILETKITMKLTMVHEYFPTHPLTAPVPKSSTYREPQQPPPGEGGEGGGLTDADIETNWDEAIESFDAMELNEELLRGIYAYGFEKPSAIQQRAIRPTILGRDLIAQAQSGTVR